MTCVVARPNESFEELLHRFIKAVEKDGIIADYKKHQVYEKPSVVRRRKEETAKKRALKRQAKIHKKSHQNFKFNKDKTKKIQQPHYKNRNDNE